MFHIVEISKMGFGPFFFGTVKNMLNKRADKLELLRIAEAVALEKSIDKELIIESMETGIAKAAKSKFGQDNEIKVLINRDSGDIDENNLIDLMSKIFENQNEYFSKKKKLIELTKENTWEKNKFKIINLINEN